jgi:DnaJ-class molecular chaperone
MAKSKSPKLIKCPECYGRGKVLAGNPQEDDGRYIMNCPLCHGTGKIKDRRKKEE